MVTLVIGGIFILLLLNNQDKGFSITSAIVGTSNGSSFGLSGDKAEVAGTTVSDKVADTRNNKNIAVELGFDKVPKFKECGKVNFPTFSTFEKMRFPK